MYGRSKGTDPLILNLDTTARPLYRRYTLNMRLIRGLVGPRTGMNAPAEIRTPDRTARSIVTIPTAVYGDQLRWLRLGLPNAMEVMWRLVMRRIVVNTGINFKVSKILLFYSNSCTFIHLVVCLTTGPKPLPKPALHIVRSRASSFKWEYPHLSLRSSNSFLRLLPCLPVTSIPPCIFPSITRCRRQSRRKMWPIQFAFRLRISWRIFLCSLTLSNTSMHIYTL